MQYNWNFHPLEAYPLKDEKEKVIFNVHWQFHGKKEHEGKEYTSSVIGVQNLPLSEGEFIPFEELTKEIVQGWIETAMGEERIIAMKESLEKQIDNQIKPPVLILSLWPSPSQDK